MKKVIPILLLFALCYLSCKSPKSEKELVESAKQYYQALDESNSVKMKNLISDSILIKELDYDYEQTFLKSDYINDWMRWDSIFKPSYDLLSIKEENDFVKVKMAKTDKRIHFLHEKPIVWTAKIQFDEGKIISIERRNAIFDEDTWETNLNKLIAWINIHHPELNDFLSGQTKTTGLKYLKAIELYNENSEISEPDSTKK